MNEKRFLKILSLPIKKKETRNIKKSAINKNSICEGKMIRKKVKLSKITNCEIEILKNKNGKNEVQEANKIYLQPLNRHFMQICPF